MGSRLYVGNLPFTVDEAQLRSFFSQAGHEPSEVSVITDRETGRSRGFAFVTLASAEAAKAALQALNGSQLAGRALTIDEARERTGGGGGGGGWGGESRGRGGYGGGGGGGRSRW